MKHSSEILGSPFFLWELGELQVDAAPAGLQDTSSAQGLTEQDAPPSWVRNDGAELSPA